MSCHVLWLIYTDVSAKKDKGKFICARPCRPEGGIEVFLHSFLILAQDRGKWQASNLVERALVPLGYEAGWTPEPVGTFWRREQFFVPARIHTLDHPNCSLVTILTTLCRSGCFRITFHNNGGRRSPCNVISIVPDHIPQDGQF